MYIHETKTWPTFTWRESKVAEILARVRHKQGRLVGRMEGLGFNLRREATLYTLTEDVLKSSEIEGEDLDKDQVRSSIARRLGMDIAGLVPADRHVEGVVEMMLDATQQYLEDLTKERFFAWHAALFPTGYSGLIKITVADWRNDKEGPMQVVSGPMGKEVVHYEAPAAERIKNEIQYFLKWFNGPPDGDPVLRAAISHLWFVTIHPFEDGNGRIARAIADMSLSRSEESSQRFYSMSAQIRQERNAYYNILEATQKGDTDITDWLLWFLECLERAVQGAEIILKSVLVKADFWEFHKKTLLNARQQEVLNLLLGQFEGKLTSSKWAKLTKSSQDTALRDINDLVDKGVLEKGVSSGRSTHYIMAHLRKPLPRHSSPRINSSN
ncbi:Fic family protein [Hellea sp.]|nr:Fic family protein [Hellea sp.]